METSNLKSHLDVKSYCVKDTFSSTDRKNPPKLVPYRNDIRVLDNFEAENSSPPHLLPEVIVTRTKINKVTASPRQNAECDRIKVALEVEAIRSKLKANASSSCIRTENVLNVSQTEGNDENRAPKSSSHMLSVSAHALPNAVIYKNSANMTDELHLGTNIINSKQKLPQLNVKLEKSPEVNCSARNYVKQHMKAHDKSNQFLSLWDHASYSNEDDTADIIEVYNKKGTKKIENESKLVATEIKRMGGVNEGKSHDTSLLISVSKEKSKNTSEENVFSYPQCKLPKMLDLNNAQRVRSSSKSSGCVTINLNQNEPGSFSSLNIQNKHETALNFEVSNEQMAKNICNDLVNKVVKKCDYNKLSKWPPYSPSSNIWVTAHEDYKNSSQKVLAVKKQHIKSCNMQSILKSKQKPGKDTIPNCEGATKSDIHLLCLGPNELKLDISNETFQSSNFSGKESINSGKDSNNLVTVDIIANNIDRHVTEPAISSNYSLCSSKVSNREDVNNVQFEAEKVGNCKSKSPSSPNELHSNSNKDNLMTVDSFGRNLLLGCNTSWPGNMEASFSGGRRSYVSSVPDYWSEIDDDDEEEEYDKGDESLRQRISTGKEERDTIDGVEFLAFETERDMVEFTKIEQDIQCNSCCDQGTNSDDGLDMMDDSFNSCGDHDAGSIHQAIVPTKTKDITKIKGWRNKHFAVNNNPSHCISSNNSNGPYEDDDGFESLDVKIQDEVVIEEEPESSVETKENRDLEDQQSTSSQYPVKTNVSCDDEVIKPETKEDILQAELNTDDKIKKAAFVSDEAEKFFSEFVSPDIAFDIPQFKPEEVTACLPTSNLMRLSPRLQRLPPRKPITFWKKGFKYKALAEKKMLMAMKSSVVSSNSSKRKLGRPRKKKRRCGRPRIYSAPSNVIEQNSKSLKEQLVSGKKLLSTISCNLDPDYKYTWVAGKPIRITGSKKQMLEKLEDQSSHIKGNNTSDPKVQSTEVLANKLDIKGTADVNIFSSTEQQNMQAVMKLQENEEISVEAIQPAEVFSLVGNVEPTSSFQILAETEFPKSKVLTDRKLCNTSIVKLTRNQNISVENKSANSIKVADQLESSANSSPIIEIKSSRNKNIVEEISTARNTQYLKENKSESSVNEEAKLCKISHDTEQNKESRVAANKLDAFKQKVEELESSKLQIIKKDMQNTEIKEKNKQDMCNKNPTSDPWVSLSKGKRNMMVIRPCVGRPLHPEAVKTLYAVRGEETVIDETWAKFAVSVVTSHDCLPTATRVKRKVPESKRLSFSSREEKLPGISSKMKTRGIKTVNYREKTRITCQPETLKKKARIPISGVVTRKRSAAQNENARNVSVTNTDDETNEPTGRKYLKLNKLSNKSSDVSCVKLKMSNAEETKKAAPTSSKQLATSTRTYSQTSEKEGRLVPKTRKYKEDICSSIIESQKLSRVNETDSNSCFRNERVTSETSSKEELNAICSKIADERDSTVLKATDDTATSKRLAVLIEMCSKTAVCETNDCGKSKRAISSMSETCTSPSSDESLLEHKTKSSNGSNMPSSPSISSPSISSPTQSPLMTVSETDQAIPSIKEGNALFETRNKENEISLSFEMNSKENTIKMPDKVSDVQQCNTHEMNSENEKGHATLNKTSDKISSDKNDNVTCGINNNEHLCSSEIHVNASNVGSSKKPEGDSMETKSSRTSARKRLIEVKKLFNEDDLPKKCKIGENTALPSVKVVLRKLSTSSEMLLERREICSKTENSKIINPASRVKHKDARILSSNIGKEMALSALIVEEQEHKRTKTLSGCVEKKTNNTSLSENSRYSISEDLKAEIHCLLEDMVNCVVCHEIQDLIINDDPDGCSDSQSITSHSPKKYKKKTKLNRELSRLSANLIVMNEYEVEKYSAGTERQVAINCKNDFCQLGCICDSLLGSHVASLPDHCGKPSCMFECSCSNRMISQNDKAPNEKLGDRNHSRLYRTAVHLIDQGSRHLAKVEKEFSHTVIHSGKETVVVGGGSISDGGRRRREIKLPERYRDYNVAIGKEFALAECKMISAEPALDAGSSDTCRTLPSYVEVQVNQTAPSTARKKPKPLKGKLTSDQKMALFSERYGIKPCSVRLMPICGIDDVVPWCMAHKKYNCFCRGIRGRPCKKPAHSTLERAPPLCISEKDVSDSTRKSATEMPKVQRKSRNKAIKSTTRNMHTHDVERYSARTKGVTMNYLLRNKSQYFKQKMRFEQQQQQQNTSHWITETRVVEMNKPDVLVLTSAPENALIGPLNTENLPPVVEQTEFGSENVAQDEDIGFGKIVSITTLKPEEFEQCGTLEEINEADAGDIVESDEPTEAYNPEALANEADTEGLFENTGRIAEPETSRCRFSSSNTIKASDEQIISSASCTTGVGKDSGYARIAKLISMKKDEIRALLKKGECSLNLSQYEKCAIQVIRWPILCRKFKNGEVNIWVHKQGTSKILVTEKELQPDMYSTNLRKYFSNKHTKLPPLIQAMMKNLVAEENEDEKNADAYGLFYCDGKNWEFVGCMRKIADKSFEQEKESEINYPEAENVEWQKGTELQKENVNKPVIDTMHEGLQGNLNELITIKKEYDPEEQRSASVLEVDRTLPEFRNDVHLSDDASKDLNAISEEPCACAPQLYNPDGASHTEPYLIQTQDIEGDSNVNNIVSPDMGEDLTMSVFLKNEDFGYETKNVEDSGYNPTEFVAFSKGNIIPASDKRESLSLTKLLNSADFKSQVKQTIKNTEFELQLPKCSFPCRWYVFAIRTSFDVLRFYKRGRNISFKQINEAIKIANKKNKTIRIPLDNETNPLENHCPKFGIYAIPNIASHFFIGPYGHHEKLGFQALKSCNGILVDTHMTCVEWNKESDRQEIQRNCGMWYYAVKREETENDTDTDSEKIVKSDVKKSKMKPTLTSISLEPHCSTAVEAVNMQTEAKNKERDDRPNKSRRKQTLTMRSVNSMCTSSSKIELGHPSAMNEEKEVFQRRISADSNEEEELDVTTPYDVSSVVQEMKDDIQRNTTQHKLQGAAATQTVPDRGSILGDGEEEFKAPPSLPSLLHPFDDPHRGPKRTAVSIKLVPSIPSLGFISAFMYHNKSIQLINPFADYREAKLFKNLSNLTRWLTCEIRKKMKYIPEDLKLVWRVRQASQNIKNCRAFNPMVLDGTYILTDRGVLKIRNSGEKVNPDEGTKKFKLRRSFDYLRETLMAGKKHRRKLTKHGLLIKAVEEIKRLGKQVWNYPETVNYLKQQRLDTFKRFCGQLRGFTNEEKRRAMIRLKNVMRRPTIPVVQLDDDQDNTENKWKSRNEGKAFAAGGIQSSDESSIEDYLSDDEADSNWAHKGENSRSVDYNEAKAHKAKENNNENTVIISSDGDEDDERPLSQLLQNAEKSKFNTHGNLSKNSKDLLKSMSLSHKSNTQGESLLDTYMEDTTSNSSEESLQHSDSVSQISADEKDSVSISIVTEDQLPGNAEESQGINRDIVTLTCVTQDTEQETSSEGPKSENKNLKSSRYQQKTSSADFNDMKLVSTQLLTAPENGESIKEVDITNSSNQENAVLTKEKDSYVSESAESSAKHVVTKGATVGANKQFLINGIPVSSNSGGFCYMMPPLLAQRSGLSVAVGPKKAEHPVPLLKRVWVAENSVAANAEKMKQTSSEPPQKVRIISAPEEWNGRIISNQNTSTTKLTYVNASGNIQTPQSVAQQKDSIAVNLPVLPTLVIPNNKVISKAGYHLLTGGAKNFKIVQTHKKVDIEFPTTTTTQSSPQQISIRRPIRILPAGALRNVADPAQQNAQEGPKQVIKLHPLTGVERPNSTGQLKNVLINGQKVFVQNAERTYPLLVASPNSGRGLNSAPVFSAVQAKQSESSTDSASPSNIPKNSSQSMSPSYLNSGRKTMFVSSSNYSNALKSEAMKTANRCSFSPLGSLCNGSNAFWIKRPINQPVMLKVVNSKASAAASSTSAAASSTSAVTSKASAAASSTSAVTSSASSILPGSSASSSAQGCSNVFQAVSLKCAESMCSSPIPEVSRDSDEAASCTKTDSRNSKSDVLSNVSQRNTENKEPEAVDSECSKTSTVKCKSTKTNVSKCITEETSSKSVTSQSKQSKSNSTEAKKNINVKDGVTTRRSREVIVRTGGMTTRSSKAKNVKS